MTEERRQESLDRLRDRHPGYVIGSHWLETAYNRICAGEAEADVLRDYPPFAVLTAEIERLRASIVFLRIGLNRISYAGQDSMSSKEECGRIARQTLEETLR